MSLTYSINVGQPTETTRKADVFALLGELPDNTSKLISPRDVRDAFLSTWANSAFKVTTPSTFSNAYYIGVDSGNPSNRDQKSKILLGKRQFGNLDVLSTGLINSSQTDVFIYNTKPDSVTQSSTRMQFLAGTNSLLFPDAPYIESLASSNGISLNIVNPSTYDGPINILSPTGRVAINGIVFPTQAETAGSASNGRILRYFGTYPFGYLKWDDPTVSFVNIGNPGSPTNIYGSPVNVNGYPLEFVDINQVPVKVGDFNPGDTFATGSFFGQDWPMVEVIRRVLYPYIEPELQFSFTNLTSGNNLAVIGVTQSLVFSYSLTTWARNSSESITDYHFRVNNTYLTGGTSFSATPSSVTSGTFGYATFSNSIGTFNFNMLVATIPGATISFGHSFSATASLNWVYPTFFGFNSTLVNSNATFTSTSQNLNVIATTWSSGSANSVGITGSGYIYFAYPSTFGGDIQRIVDPNGFILYDLVTASFSSFTSSTFLNTNLSQNYRVWRLQYVTNYLGSGQFQFIF
jgi:hypothetical protein